MASSFALSLDAEKFPERGLIGRAGLCDSPASVLCGRLDVWVLEQFQEVLVRAGDLGPGEGDHLRLLGRRLPAVVVVHRVVAQNLGVLHERLGQVAAYLLPDRLLHRQMALQVPEVTLSQRVRLLLLLVGGPVARVAGGLTRVSVVMRLLLIVGVVVPRRRQRAGRGRLLAPGPRRVVVGPHVTEHVPDMGNSAIHGGHRLIRSRTRSQGPSGTLFK